jgi:type I restriction enzyme S subunit
MVTARDINSGRILYETARRTSEEAYKSDITDKSRPDVGDVLVTKDGTLGRMAVVDRPDVCINQSVALLKPKETIRPRFLKYLLEEPRNFARMLGDADGTTIKHIYITRLAKMEVSVPSVDYQDRVLGVLASLDDKIELNRQMNETLEEMARTLFRDWFVDFGPTRRQMAMKEKGLAKDPVAIMGNAFPAGKAAELAALFPNKLGEDGLPEGWEDRPLDQVGQFLNGLALQRFPAQQGMPDLPVIKIAELRSGISAKSNRASTEVPDKYIIGNGDFIFSWSGSLLAKFWTGGEGALNQHLFKVTSESHPMWFVSEWVHTHLEEFQRIAASKAVTMGHIKRSHLTEAICVCPPDESLVAFGKIFDPLVSKQIANDEESQTLAEMRDLLLPKLMSGEIRLKDAEANMGKETDRG